MTITPETARSFADDATLKVETPTRIEKDQVFYSLVTDYDRTVATDLDKGDAELLAIAPDLAQTIAGMTEQWRHEAWHDRGDGVGPWRSLGWPHDDGWRNTRESADFDLEQADGTFKHRLVRRLVGPVEAVDGE